MEIIARIENGFREKFGVPRQSGLVPEVISRVVMAEKYSVREAFRGIEDYSHLWLLWEFDRAQQDDWRPCVRRGWAAIPDWACSRRARRSARTASV